MLQTILYVDDDLALARLAQRYLGRAGYDVVHAADSSSALEALENGSFSAIEGSSESRGFPRTSTPVKGAGSGPMNLRLSIIATLLPFATSLPALLSLMLIATSEWRRSW